MEVGHLAKALVYRVLNGMKNGAKKHRPWFRVASAQSPQHQFPQCNRYPYPCRAVAARPQKIH